MMPDSALNHRLALDRPGRRFLAVSGSRWGELVLPAPEEVRAELPQGLRLVLFVSFEFGYLVLEAAKAYQRRFPDRLQLVAVVTDDPADPTALIGLRKRVWKYFDQDARVAAETAVVEAALSAGVPAYTGEVKVAGFRDLLTMWRPDAIVSCVFGQVIDRWIIEKPAYGIYNFHPSDLAHGYGAGISPAQDLMDRGATTTVWTIHHTVEAVDSGHIVAVSPSVRVCNEAGVLPGDPRMIYDKLLEPVGALAVALVDALVRRTSVSPAGKLETVDVSDAISTDLRDRMLAPIAVTCHGDELPVFNPMILERCAAP
ncbi:formyltransferase family protein [Acidisoma cladoniae]|jgi:hypothetical protein|uniref:formyltransferase family protein n=1 Tax=Acidisoma cladoniae TaxID=3040935 RepID=UPI00254B29A8|nr:formyltransferase family protein [Acidisoma sp. PAMC 29798]